MAATAHAPDDRPWETLGRLADSGDSARLTAHVKALAPGEAGRVLSFLSDDEQSRILTLMPADEAAQLVEQLPDVQAADLIEELPPADAAAILHELPSNEQADLLGAIVGPRRPRRSSAAMDPEEAADARRLARTTPTTWPAG